MTTLRSGVWSLLLLAATVTATAADTDGDDPR